MYSMPKTLACVVMLSLLAVAGCETQQEMPYQTMELAEPVDVLHKVIGGHPDLKDGDVVLINSQSELDAVGIDGLVGRDVNFLNEQVVLATLGECPTAGYWINVTAVHQEGDVLQVYGQANRPGGADMAGQMLTYPYCVVIVPRTGAIIVRDQIESVEGLEPPM